MADSLVVHTDEELAGLFKETGDNKYFTALSVRYEKNILRKCKSYVKDEDTAEDLYQEVLIKLFLQIKNYQRKAKFYTWLFAIIHNICIDHLRRNKKNVRGVITEKLADELGEIIDDEDEIPEELSEKILDQLLEQISPEQKMLLLMKYKEKHHIKDIQITLGLSESAVKMRLKRAKEKVNRLYHKHK